ncbi:YjgF-like protein [Dothidotthia symphoricarpi CBS 119687]|uniref:YjgF-like protein n=1 Tax=Dothidotthia symphoricarpi CBS 119687 TaxID=1392245 RepID=A0A6A6ACD0_9PLEO|nr:YjgF-like protein [Dothidotthia symphoricarpi CBS 119687]KAF2129246.1 YjgF-like protein [Dothidotthia symphoricarpi CBS 119687]
MASSNKPHAFNPSSVPKPPPTYDQVCITPLLPTSKLVTLAGQTGITLDRSISPDFLAQVKQAYQNLQNCLKAAGATPRDIVHVRHYIVTETGIEDLDRKEIVDRGWGELWIELMDKEAEGHRPPDTVLGVASLAKKKALYEVEAWALISG